MTRKDTKAQKHKEKGKIATQANKYDPDPETRKIIGNSKRERLQEATREQVSDGEREGG